MMGRAVMMMVSRYRGRSTLLFLEFTRRLHNRQKQQGPTTTATCYVVSVSQAREVEAMEGFHVEV